MTTTAISPGGTRLSLLDRSRTRAGEPDAAAVTETVRRAVRAEQLGYHRFLVAEHHAVPGIAGSAPAVVLAAIGARTSCIRLGAAGVMLPNHVPLVVAEQFSTLAALFPGRVDLGAGGSLGFTAPVRQALGTTEITPEEYGRSVEELQRYLRGEAAVTVRPQAPPPPMLLLAIRTGHVLAARLGLPVIIGGPLLDTPAAAEAYRRGFQPGPWSSEPRVLVSADAMIAASPERARSLLLPEAWAQATASERGEFPPLRPHAEIAAELPEVRREKKRAAIERHLDTAIAGTAADVAQKLQDLAARHGADEVVVSISTFDRDAVADADAALARAWAAGR